MVNKLVALLFTLINVLGIWAQNFDSLGNPLVQQCPEFDAEQIPYPTPFIGTLDRADRCYQLFPRFNTSGTATLSFVGQNTYYNPCKIDCGLCEDELPTNKNNTLRHYPAHITIKDNVVKCPGTVEVFEQYMEDGIKCGNFHVCDNRCCVAHPELFPKASARYGATSTRPTPQDRPADWTLPLTCEEEGFFRNPNNCHKFYRCYKSGSSFAKTLFDCNPATAVFDDGFKVCVAPEDTDICAEDLGEDVYRNTDAN